MLTLSLLLGGALLLILFAAELFTNALEHLGQALGISEGVTGSLFAAVGTALPETLVPLLAIFTGTTEVSVGEEIGVGAILGAPLMLSTLTLSLMGVGALSRDQGRMLSPEPLGLKRDLNYFLVAFVLATLAMLVPTELRVLRVLISVTLCGLYFAYVATTLRASRALVASGHGTQSEGRLAFARVGLGNSMASIVAQVIVAVALLLFGAQRFIQGVEGVAEVLHITPLLLSLMLVPIATELPEKINSIRWIRRGRDTLAFGNVTGAMVFQGSLLPALGILLTPWTARREVIGGVCVTLAGALWLRFAARRNGISAPLLFINGLLYVLYLSFELAH